jgi:group I intron endonuclease
MDKIRSKKEIHKMDNKHPISFNNLLESKKSIIIFNNAETDKSTILTAVKEKAGIYMWTHKETGKSYVGSAFELHKRLINYYNKSYLNSHNSMYIYKAILNHGYGAFSLSILEYIDISNLSLEDARKLILERKQYYFDSLKPYYNILIIAGSCLGHKHSEQTIAKISGENNPMFGRTGEKHPLYGSTLSIETREKISKARGKIVYVYSSDKSTLINTFDSYRKAAENFNVNPVTIIRYTKSQKLFKDKWILSTTLK